MIVPVDQDLAAASIQYRRDLTGSDWLIAKHASEWAEVAFACESWCAGPGLAKK